MELVGYIHERWIEGTPEVLLRPLNEVLYDFLVEEVLIIAVISFMIVAGVFACRLVMQIKDALNLNFEDKATQTDPDVDDKQTQTLNYYKPRTPHTLTRRLVLVEESMAFHYRQM